MRYTLRTTLCAASISAMVFLFVYFVTPSFAATYVPLTPLPGAQPGEGISKYLNSIYLLTISIAAIFAVIKIAIAGTKYMLSEVVTNKEEAKKDINSAVFGLIIILSTYIVLYTIYPNLVNLNILGSYQSVDVGQRTTVAPRGSTIIPGNINDITFTSFTETHPTTDIAALNAFIAKCVNSDGSIPGNPAGNAIFGPSNTNRSFVYNPDKTTTMSCTYGTATPK